MRSHFLCVVFALCGVALMASASSACINDRETVPAEREFKSNYMDKTRKEQPAIPEYSPAPSDRFMVYGGLGSGAILLLGAVMIGLKEASAS